MNPNLQSPIASLGLSGLRILKVTEDKAEVPGSSIKSVTIEMTVGNLGIS